MQNPLKWENQSLILIGYWLPQEGEAIRERQSETLVEVIQLTPDGNYKKVVV